MENAADAIKLAGEVLIGVLLITLVVYLFRNMSLLENTKKDIEVTEEISEFNKKYLAFDKTTMYGTDVISVLGLAISNNKIQNQSVTANPDGRYNENVEYSVNIEIEVKDPINRKITKTLTHEIIIGDGAKTELVPTSDQYKSIYTTLGFTIPITNPQKTTIPLLGAGTYSLKTQDLGTYKILEDIAINSGGKIKRDTKTWANYTVDIEEDDFGLDDFKKQIYKCEKVGNDASGRINYMKFVPKT